MTPSKVRRSKENEKIKKLAERCAKKCMSAMKTYEYIAEKTGLSVRGIEMRFSELGIPSPNEAIWAYQNIRIAELWKETQGVGKCERYAKIGKKLGICQRTIQMRVKEMQLV